MAHNGHCERVILKNDIIEPSESRKMAPVGTSNQNSRKASRKMLFERSPLYCHWSLLLVILRIVGSCPVTHKIGNGHQKRSEFRFRWVSWPSFYSLVVHLLRIALCVWYYKDWGPLLLGRNYQDSVFDWIIRILNYSIPLHHIWDIVVVWATGERFARLGRRWIHFDHQFQETFQKETGYYFRNKKWYCSMSILFAAVLTGVAGGTIGEIVIASEPTIDIGQLLRVFPTLFFASIIMLEEMRTMFMYFAASEHFRYIRLGIEDQIKGSLDKVPTAAVSKWTELLMTLREIVKSTGEFQAPYLIPVFLHIVVMLTGLLFIAIQALMTGNGIKHFYVALTIGTTAVVRIILKIIMAETIVTEEESVSDLLLTCDTELFDLSGKLEICKIIETLQQKPSKVSLSGYITVQKKLITKMMGHVVGYLVVLIQFDLGYYVKDRPDCVNVTKTE